MSTDDTATGTNRNQDTARPLLAGAIRGAIRAAGTDTVTTATITETVGAPREHVAEVLDVMADDEEITRVTASDESTGWIARTESVDGYSADSSYVVSDQGTGLVTRASDRPGAYRRLADRLDQFAAGEHIGAQVLGIAERVMGPSYLADVAELVTEYVDPDDRHLYVYVEDDGVVEVTRSTTLTRSQSIQGFALTGVYTQSAFAERSVVPIDRLFADTIVEPSHFPLGVFKLSAVHPEHQRRGIGRALTTHGMAYLAQHPPVVAMLWDRSDNPGNVKIAEQYPGTERLGRFEDATPLGRQCPVCGFETECSCGTILYGWGFDVIDG